MAERWVKPPGNGRWIDWATEQKTANQHCAVYFGAGHNLQKAHSGSQRKQVMLHVEKITETVRKAVLSSAWVSAYLSWYAVL